MALTYVFLASAPLANAIATGTGKLYSANSSGVITGVTPADAQTLQGVAGASLQLMAATGATTDRPATMPAALTGALNNVSPFPGRCLPFHDTTLAKEVYFDPFSPTLYVDYTGASA